LMSEETWMDAEMALDAGFVDSIDYPPEEDEEEDDDDVAAVLVHDLRVASGFALKGFQHAAAFKNSLKKIMSKQLIVKKNDPTDDDGGDPKGIVSNERNRIREIMDLATAVKERDNKDFFNEARKAIDDLLSPAEFSQVIVTSQKYKAQGGAIG